MLTADVATVTLVVPNVTQAPFVDAAGVAVTVSASLALSAVVASVPLVNPDGLSVACTLSPAVPALAVAAVCSRLASALEPSPLSPFFVPES